jgi:TonB-linked SusC/RagA family outer membrane protein
MAGLLALLLVVTGAGRAQAQNAVLTGKVTGEAGQPLSPANIFIGDLNVSVATNASGTYTITIPAERVRGQQATIRVRAIGYTPATQLVTIRAGSQTFDFSLKKDVNRLTDVVVTGVTAATERQKVPFAVTRVDSSSMPVIAVNPLTQLQGKVPGATIVSASGRPGAQPSVLLRGPTSINASNRNSGPLYIVDGVILDGGLPDINGQDIESVEVLKGASAATLYGSRAAGGVIQIKTKTGKGLSNGVQFAFRSEYGMSDVERDFGISRLNPLLMSEDGTRFCVTDAFNSSNACTRTIDYRQEVARINNAAGDFAISPPAFPIDPGAVLAGDVLRRTFVTDPWPGQTYNAVKQVVDPKPQAINDLSMSGRAGSTNFFASINQTNQGGAIRYLTGLKRTSGRVNVEQQIGTSWNIQANSFFSRNTQDGLNQEEGGTGFFRLTRVPAIVDVTQTDTLGRLYIRPNLQSGGTQNENPLYSFQNVRRADTRDRFIGGATVRYSPLEWFDMNANLSYDRSNLSFRQFRNRGYRTTNADPGTNFGTILNGQRNGQSYNGSLQATARRDLLTDLKARFQIGTFYEQQDRDTATLSGNTLAVADVDAASNATASQSIATGRQSQRQQSYTTGLNFDYKDRYVLDFVARRDGSSLFGSNQRWANYGRVAGSWLIGREPWWFTDKISQATLRASYGTAGNVPRFDSQYETYTIGAGGTLSPSTLGNKDLRPEVMKELEVGMELEFFNRYGLTVTRAVANTENQILPVPLSASTGFQNQWQNAGTLQNKTWEVSLVTPFIQRKDVNWTGRWNYSTTTPTITKLDVAPFFIGTNLQATGSIMKIAEGEKFGTFYGRKFATSCSDLPAAYVSQCGTNTSAFQPNNEGYLVWVGEGNNPGMGVTDNLWNALTYVNWGTADKPASIRTNFGMPIIVRDSAGNGKVLPLGHALPSYQLSFAQTATIKRLTVYGLLDGSFGQSVYNQGRHWSYLDFISRDVDQGGVDVTNAKPIGYYYRATKPDNNNGLGGFYDLLGPNNRFTEDASFMKLREVSVSYHVGRVANAGDWTASLIGRNLKTFTKYKGFDPEVGAGVSGGQSGTAAINAIDAFTFPNLRTVSFVIGTRF